MKNFKQHYNTYNKNTYICNEFSANHNKDYSVVKTFGSPIILMVGTFYALSKSEYRIGNESTNSTFATEAVAFSTSDVRKTMSYVGKIISDIIQTTSDLFSPPANI